MATEQFPPELFRSLIDAAPDAMLVVNASGSLVFVNSQVERLFGYSRAELIGQSIEALVPERFRPAHAAHRSGYSNAPRPRPMGSGLELFGRRKDGSEFPVEISLSPVQTSEGNWICAAIRDVSERKRIEARAKRMNEYLRNAVESIQGAFALFDEQDVLVLCNSTYRLMLGSGIQGEIYGKRHTELLDANLAAGIFDLHEQTALQLRSAWLAYHQQPNGELELHLSDGRSIRMIERRTSDGGTVSITWDITDDVHRAQELQAARASAEAASSAKSDFLASISHELRTPLNAILGFAQLVQRDKRSPLSERQQERMAYVVKGGEHLLRLIDDVLDLSRIESGRVGISLEPVSVGDVLQELKSTLDPLATRSDIRLELEALPPTLPHVIADRTRFAQVLMNFGSNAVKYGKAGGKALFRVSLIEQRIRVSVIDDGIGIPEDKQEKIFQPFQRAGQETGPIEGTGIGLTISKRLAEMMGGSVGFSSTPGEGSEFWVELAAHHETQAAVERVNSERAPSALIAADGDRHLIIYVEDNPSNVAFMEDFLADFERVRLITAATAEIGIELVRAHNPDLVIMDINLPGMSGFEAARRLAELPETSQIPIVALTAAALGRDLKRMQEGHFYRYLTKPVKVEELAALLDEVLLAKKHRAS